MKRLKKNIREITSSLLGATYMTAIQVNSVLAASDASSVTKPLDNLKTLVLAIIGAIGVIILAKNVMEFDQAADSSTMNSALKGIVAGVMMAGISSVLGILGF